MKFIVYSTHSTSSMRKFLFFSLWFALICTITKAQDAAVLKTIADGEALTYKPKGDLFALKLTYQQHTSFTSHFTYQLFAGGILVFGNKVKINLLNNGHILSTASTINSAACITMTDLPLLTPQKTTNGSEHFSCYFLSNGIFVSAVYTRSATHCSDSVIVSLASNGTVLLAKDMAQHLLGDTTIRAKVFLPDPLTTSSQTYGGTFVDNSDAAATWLDDSRIEVKIAAFFDSSNNLFILKNKYAEIVDQVLPPAAPVSQIADSFFYTRNQSGFEDCNALYHISTFHRYFDSLGFNTILPMAVRVDAHGNLGADNSTFYRGGAPFLDLGTGGVDDAEDADVVIHEYSHGISWSANDNFIATDERDALDEGTADYFCTSYSRNLNPFAWQKVFGWDGHNEFWAGRTAQTSEDYESAKATGNIYTLGELWNTCMMRIWDSCGAVVTDKLMFQSLFSWTDTTTCNNAAAYVLQADSILYNYAHRQSICAAFAAKGIKPTWGCMPVPTPNDIAIYNTLEYSYGSGDIVLRAVPPASQISLLDSKGSKIWTTIGDGTITVDRNLVKASGIYFLYVHSANINKTYKLARF
jgi:hypothetical protein